MATVIGTESNPGEVGILGESQEAEGVRGIGHDSGFFWDLHHHGQEHRQRFLCVPVELI